VEKKNILDEAVETLVAYGIHVNLASAVRCNETWLFISFQKLPEEEHIYRISEKDLQGSLSLNSNVGVVISRIPFTHCQNVVRIIQVR
jgi:hypothetical protein